MYFAYILKSQKDLGYYIGYTSDIERRFVEHQNGLVDSTRDRRPVELVYFEAFQSETLARKRESQLKQFGSAYKGLIQRIT